jgi:hypothetical protein
MMKKVMFVVLSLLIATAAFALESGPSNVTGYTKTIAVGGAGTVSTPFGIAFRTWDVPTAGVPSYGVNSTDPSDIVGDQTNCGTLANADRILRQDNGEFAIRNSTAGCGWTQLLQTNHNMIPGRPYWYQNRTGANRDLIIAGEADITTTYGTVTVTAPLVNGGLVSTPYSWRDPRSRDRADLQLLAAGFTGGTIATSDRCLAQVGGLFFYRRTSDNTWQGGLAGSDPGLAYWIQRKFVGNYTYTYDPTSNADLQMPGGTKIAGSNGDLQKIEAPKAKASVKGAAN